VERACTSISRVVKLVLGDLALTFIYGLATAIDVKRIAPKLVLWAGCK
jgi:hypothetical protein